MKTSFVLGVSIGLLAGAAFGQANATIVRERAKAVTGQNNARQGSPPPTPQRARTPAARPATAQPITTKLQLDLAAIKTNSPAMAALKQRLTADLTSAAVGATKPSSSSITKLADDLAAAVLSKPLTPVLRARLVQDVNAVLNAARYPAAQMNAIIADVQTVLQGEGEAKKNAETVAADLKSIAAEITRPSPPK